MAEKKDFKIPDEIQEQGAEAAPKQEGLTAGFFKRFKRKVAAMQEQTGDKARAAVQPSENSALNVKERTLSLKQTNVLISRLRRRFARNEKLHEGIKWEEVEKALRARPDLLWTLQQLEATGGEPDVFRDEGDAFRFGDSSKESPSGRRNVVFDAVTESYIANRPEEVCNGNAADRIAEWGCEFMSEAEYCLLKSLKNNVDAHSWSWLRTPPDHIFGRSPYAIVDVCDDTDHCQYSYRDTHNKMGGFRCSLRVPKVIEKSLPPEKAEILISTLQRRFLENEKLHEGIKWEEVEKALRARPDLLWTLQQLQATGGEPDVLRDEGDAFRFGDFSEDSPSGRTDVVFDAQAEVYLKKYYPQAVCNGNAADKVAEWGCEFMSKDEYYLLQKLTKVDGCLSWSWLRTPDDIRRAGAALSGSLWTDVRVIVNELGAYRHNHNRGFRCSLRVPKV